MGHEDDFGEVGSVLSVSDEGGDDEAAGGEGEGGGEELYAEGSGALVVTVGASDAESESGGGSAEVEEDGAGVGIEVEGVPTVVGSEFPPASGKVAFFPKTSGGFLVKFRGEGGVDFVDVREGEAVGAATCAGAGLTGFGGGGVGWELVAGNLHEAGESMTGPFRAIFAETCGGGFDHGDGGDDIGGEALMRVVVDESVRGGVEIGDHVCHEGSHEREVFLAPGEFVVGAQASEDEHAVEAVWGFEVVRAPVGFYPVSVIFIKEEAGAGFNGVASCFFWGGGCEGVIGFPLALEFFGGSKVEKGSVEGPFGGFDLTDFEGGGDVGGDAFVDVIGEAVRERVMHAEGHFSGAAGAQSGIGGESPAGVKSGVESEEESDDDEGDREGGSEEAFHSIGETAGWRIC